MATQTGSIDLAATNGVHLYAKGGFETAAETYATQADLEVQADRIGMVVANEDASSSLQLTANAMTYIGGNVIIKGTDGTTTAISGGKIQANSLAIGALTVEAQQSVLNSELDEQFDSLTSSMSDVGDTVDSLDEAVFGYEDDQGNHVDGALDGVTDDISSLQGDLAGKVDSDAVIDAINKSTEADAGGAVLISGAKLDIATNVSFQGLTEIANAKIDSAAATTLFAQLLTASNIHVGALESVHIEQRPSRFSFMQAGKTLDGYSDSEIAQRGSVPYEGEVAFIAVENGESTFYMNRSVVLNDLKFGNWKWYNRSNGHMTLQYVG